MKNTDIIRSITELELLDLADKYESVTDILINHFNFSCGRNTRILKDKMEEYDIEFSNPYKGTKKFEEVIKQCPVCNKEFKTQISHSKEKTTCSYECSDRYFRDGSKHVNWKGTDYRTICFSKHKKECIICGETNIVAVHHLDEDHTNNDINNLVPLCPTHHQYMHSRYKYMINKDVEDYIKKFTGDIDGLSC